MNTGMHRSKLSTFVIDCRTDDLDAATRFWSAALGRTIEPPSPENPAYRQLSMRTDEPVIYIQQVEHDSRVHLDIETDDVDAEVARLETQGAHRLHQVKSWWVLEAPTGQRFCVVKPQRGDMGAPANEWP